MGNKPSEKGCEIKISVFPYRTKKISKFLYPLVHFFIVRPKLKKYLKSVLKGLKFHLDNDVKIMKNQFGTHSWFS